MEHIPEALAVMYLALFPIVEPFGATPAFLALTHGSSFRERMAVARNAAMFTGGLLLFFLFAGRFALNELGISLPALQVAGGVIVGLAGLQMVMSPSKEAIVEDAVEGEPLLEAETTRERPNVAFTPLAMPLLGGPGAISTVMSIHARGHGTNDLPGFAIAIVLISLTIFVFLALGTRFSRYIRPSVLDAVTRIFGLITLAISAELILHGINDHSLLTDE